jgi:hypothetical protein
MRLEIRETNTSIPVSTSPMPAKRKDSAKDQSSAHLVLRRALPRRGA